MATDRLVVLLSANQNTGLKIVIIEMAIYQNCHYRKIFIEMIWSSILGWSCWLCWYVHRCDCTWDRKRRGHNCSMMTSSNRTIYRVTGHLCVEFTGPPQRPMTRSFDDFFDLHLIKRLSKHSRDWWFETLSRLLWRHCDVNFVYKCCTISYKVITPLRNSTYH